MGGTIEWAGPAGNQINTWAKEKQIKERSFGSSDKDFRVICTAVLLIQLHNNPRKKIQGLKRNVHTTINDYYLKKQPTDYFLQLLVHLEEVFCAKPRLNEYNKRWMHCVLSMCKYFMHDHFL